MRELEEIIQSVVSHPEIYVGCRRFDEVAAFIEGFAFASTETHKELRDFNRWLVPRLGFPKNFGWDSGIEVVYPNSEDGLRELGVLFNEFRRSRGKE